MADKSRRRVDAADVIVALGLILLTVGAWSRLGAFALILPGALMLWYALPSRPPFVKRDR